MNSYQSLSRESEIPENEQPLNYAEGKRSKTYATETSRLAGETGTSDRKSG